MSALILRIARGAGLMLGLGLLFSWFGVYSTGQMPFHERTVYWTTTMVVGSLTALWAVRFVRFQLMPGMPLALQLGVVAAIISVPVSLAILAMMAAGGWMVRITTFFEQFTYVYVVSLVMTVGGYAAHTAGLINWPGMETFPSRQSAADASKGGVSSLASPFFDRLPVRLRGAELYAVEAEDHYLRVHTSAGSDLILMRLADAIRELSAIEGLQTHRSWWVARCGIEEVLRANGRLALKLKTGVEAPVSRTYAPDIKAAGWA